MKRNIVETVDRDEANYDYMVGLAAQEKDKRRQKFERRQSEHKARRNRSKMNRDSRRFVDRLDDDYSDY